MTHKDLVSQLAKTTDPELREMMMAQYIVTLEQHINQLKKELAQARTVAASVYRGGMK